MKTELGPNCWSISLAASFRGSSKDLGWGTMAKPFDKQLAQLGTVLLLCFKAVRMLKVKETEVHLHRTKFVFRNFWRNSFGFILGACVYWFS